MIRITYLLIIFFLTNNSIAQTPRLILPIGHTDRISATLLSNNERYILTTSEDKTAKLWDAAAGKLIHTFKEHAGSIIRAQFSPDNKTFATADDLNTTIIWSIDDLQLLHKLSTPGVKKIIYSTSGKQLITSSIKGHILVWDIETGKIIHELKGHTSYADLLQVNKEGNLLLTGSADKTARLWDLTSGKQIFSFVHKGLLQKATFSANEKTLLTAASEENEAKLWDATTGKLIAALKHDGGINAATFSPDGETIITASDDKTAKLWNAKTAQLLYTLDKDTMNVEDAVFDKDGSLIATLRMWGRSVQVWEKATGRLLHHLQFATNLDEEIKKLQFSPDNKSLYTVTIKGKVHIWDLQTGNYKKTLEDELAIVTAFGGVDPFFTNDGNKLMGITKGEVPAVWNISTGKKLYSLQSSVQKLNEIKWSSDGKKLLTADSDKVMLWDATTGRMIMSKPHAKNDYKTFTEWGPNDQSFLVIDRDTTVKVWDAERGNLLLTIKESSEISKAMFSPNKKRILTLASDAEAKIWDAITGKLIHSLKGHDDKIQVAAFSADGKRLITSSWGISNASSKVWDAETGKLIHNLGKVFFSQVKFNNSGDAFLSIPDPSLSTENNVTVWNTATGKIAGTLKGHTRLVFDAHFSNDGSLIVSCSDDFTVKVWNAKKFNVKTTFKEHKDAVSNAVFNKDATKVLSGSADNTVILWNIDDARIIQTFKGHNDWIENALFTPDEKGIITTSYDNTNMIWEARSGKPLYKFFAVNDEDFFVQDVAGYYMSSRDASKKLHYINEQKSIITFDQLDIKYNRPDVVLQSLPNGDTTLISSYKKAYDKRIKKLGIDTTIKTEQTIPIADFVNRTSITAEQNGESLTLQIKGSDKKYNLDKLNIWINEVPLFGIKGIDLKRRQSASIDTAITVSLSQGDNVIETSVTTTAGGESFKMPLYVRYVPTQPKKEKLHFIGIGINEFKDGKNSLQWCVKDIRDLAVKMKETWGNDVVIDTLFNEKVTVNNVLALKNKLQQTSINDRVVLAFSGHGLLSKDFDYYLSTYDVNFDAPEEKGLSYEALESLLDGIPSRKKLMLLDACHSGEVDKEEMAKYEKSKIGIDSTARSRIKLSSKSKVGMKNSFELMQELFVNVSRSTGATIISAAAGTQFALERANLQNGVFTFSILEYMNANKEGTVSGLKRYVNKRVPELTNGMQVPTTRNETTAVDWNLW